VYPDCLYICEKINCWNCVCVKSLLKLGRVTAVVHSAGYCTRCIEKSHFLTDSNFVVHRILILLLIKMVRFHLRYWFYVYSNLNVNKNGIFSHTTAESFSSWSRVAAACSAEVQELSLNSHSALLWLFLYTVRLRPSTTNGAFHPVMVSFYPHESPGRGSSGVVCTGSDPSCMRRFRKLVTVFYMETLAQWLLSSVWWKQFRDKLQFRHDPCESDGRTFSAAHIVPSCFAMVSR